MTHAGHIETNCECRYTLTLTDQVVQGEFSEMKDNFNHVPSIHEVDEDETDEECTYKQEHANPENASQVKELQKDIPDDESAYSGESFCSEESCDESEATDIISKSLNGSCSSPTDANCKFTDDPCETPHNKIREEESQGMIYEDRSIRSSCNRSMASKEMRNRRKNMSFTDEEMHKIERENQLLLRKIMAQQRPRDKILRENIPQPKASSSAINRKKLQRKIEYDNMLLLQRIQQTKSCVMNTTKKPGCRLTFL